MPQPADMPHARAIAGPPCGRREQWSITVVDCPWCRSMHHHRVVEAARLLSGRIVRRCPVTGRRYALASVQRRREAMRRE